MELDSIGMATWFGATGAIATAIVALVVAAQLRNRERRQALVDLHVSLTSADTARARDIVGNVLISGFRKSRIRRAEAIGAYFQLIWAIQRARNVFRMHGFHWTSIDADTSSRAQRNRAQEVEDALTWNLHEIAHNIIVFHDRYGMRWNVEDEDAWNEIHTYISKK